MSSTRLPGKVLQDIAGMPMLVHVVERTRLANTIDQVVVATTSDPADDPIEELCKERSYPCYRGSLYDVLDRYYQAARIFAADVIVRITSDCPLIDPGIVDKTVCQFLGIPTNQSRPVLSASTENHYDFGANRLPPPWGRTYPIGLDTEVCTFAALEIAWREAQAPHQREHVMPFFYDHPERFRILHVNNDVDYGTLRWTVDTPDDLELVRQIFAKFPGREDFSWLEVLELRNNEPQLFEINSHIQAKDYRQSQTKSEALNESSNRKRI